MSYSHSVAVFCGSRTGHNPAHLEAAMALGEGLAAAGMRLVYGGGRIGLMGAVAAGVAAGGGEVVGVIPEFLKRAEVVNEAATELIVTQDMHTRKQRMYELSDAFVCFSGGLGTLDEAFEVITWRQLGLHAKPILITDVAGAGRPFVELVEAIIAEGFAPDHARELYEVAADVPATLARLKALL